MIRPVPLLATAVSLSLALPANAQEIDPGNWFSLNNAYITGFVREPAGFSGL